MSDRELTAVAGGPARPLSYGNVIGSARGTWVARMEEPLLLLEAPQNAPAGGAFLTSFFSGEAGPQQVDWQWLPHSTARRPRESLVLFDRVGIPADDAEVGGGTPGAAPERTPFEVAAHAVPWFWATLLWNAKHAARHPGGSRLPMLDQTVGAFHDVERHLGVRVARTPADHPTDRLQVLVELAERMEGLMSRASELTTDVPATVPSQFRRYLQTIRLSERRLGS